ncbi:MAG: N-acyl homoserine lactonase family protein [Chloroflexi bacterium]|nr:N-acyl homoserine lactonase family protein [Chloroflexota bacterium]
MALELLLFQTGAVDIVRRAFHPWLPEPERSEMRRQPVWSALIRTPEGNVLFDTGLHPVHVARPEATFGPLADMKVVMTDEDGIVARLASVGLRPEDVTVVVNSHLHFDHAGNNGAFPRATFVVQRDHLAFARERRQSFPGVYWDIPALMYLPADGRMRVAKGVEVVPTPGHAAGHQSLVVDLPEMGRVVLCGDAAYTRENLERGETSGPDRESARSSLALIRSLVNEDLDRAFPSHDASAWATWRHAPASYR